MLLLALALLVQSSTPPDSVSTLFFDGPAETLDVCIYDAAPIAMEDADGQWSGLAPALLRQMAEDMDVRIAWTKVPEAGAHDALLNRQCRVLAVADATEELERKADLTLAYYGAALGVASGKQDGLWQMVKRFFSKRFFSILAWLSALLLIVGVLIWILERKENDDDFREDKVKGIWDGFWWAGVTMSTIGYGDLVPKTVGGRIVALVWMILSMGVTATLTAAVVSVVGFGGGQPVELPGSVRGDRIGVVSGSLAEVYLKESGVTVRPFPEALPGLQAVLDDSLDVFVGSTPHLRSEIQNNDLALEVESTRSEPQQWVFAVESESNLRERLNLALLRQLDGPGWPALIDRYIPQPN